MRNIWTRILSMVLVLALMISCVPAGVIRAWATEIQEDQQANDWQTSLDNLNAEMDKLGAMLSADGTELTPEWISQFMAVRFIFDEDYTYVDRWSGEETFYEAGSICEPYELTTDLANPDAAPKVSVQIGVRDPDDYEAFTPLEGGKVEVIWAYSITNADEGGGDGDYWPGGTPIGMSKAHFTHMINTYCEKHPDEHLIGLWGQLDGWTTDLTMPGAMTVGELRGQEADYYTSQYDIYPHVRYTPEGSEEPIYFSNFPEVTDGRMIAVYNSNGIEKDGEQFLPSTYPTRLDGVPSNYQTDEDIPYGTVEAQIDQKYTPVTFYGQMWNEADGYNDFRAFGWQAEASHLWMVVENMDGEALDTDGPFVPELTQVRPVGMPKETWQGLVDSFIADYPDEYAAGDYTDLYQILIADYWDYWPWQSLGKLPLYPDRLVEEFDEEYWSYQDWELTGNLEDYSEHTYTCLLYWYMDTGYEDVETGEWVDQHEELFGFSRPVTIVPVLDISQIELDEGEPLPELSRTAIDGGNNETLVCDASYGLTKLSYQWYRSETNDYNGVAMTNDYATEATYLAPYPTADEVGKTYYYYCEYSFVNTDGETETHRTNIAGLQRMGVGELDITVSPGALYLGELPGNTDGFKSTYTRFNFQREDMPVWDPQDTNIPWGYQVVGEENTLSVWIEPEHGLDYIDTLTYQWYKSSTYDYTEDPNAAIVGTQATVSGFSDISLVRMSAAGTTVLGDFNALNQYLNVHTEVTAEDMDPFYMTAVVTAYFTDNKGVEHSWPFTHTCKIIPVAENEDLYGINSDGVIYAYSGHQSTMILPAEINGKAVTSVGRLSQYSNNIHSYPEHVAGPKKIVVSAGIPEIGENAFYRLLSVEEVVLEEGLKRIDDFAFRDAGWIKSLQLPASLETIGTCAFDRSRIQEVIFNKNSWPTLEGSVFHKSQLAHVVFPEVAGELPVESEHADNFLDCPLLQWVENYRNITNLDRDANFQSTPAYEYLLPQNGGGSDGIMIYMPNEDGTWNAVKAVDPKVEHLTVPSTFEGIPVTSVGRGHSTDGNSCMSNVQLVYDPGLLKSVVLPSSITAINQYAFNGCENLETVSFHSKIDFVGYRAFQSCYRLKSSVILAKGAVVEDQAFEFCWSIESVDAPQAKLGQDSFRHCFSLAFISEWQPLLPELAEGEETYEKSYSYSNFYYTKLFDDYGLCNWVYISPTESLPVETDEKGTFRTGNIIFVTEDGINGEILFYTGIYDEKVTLPSVVEGPYGEVSLTKVYGSVFRWMLAEEYEAVFSEGIVELRVQDNFDTMYGLKKVSLPDSLVEIHDFFRGSEIEEITIPRNVEYLDSDYYALGNLIEVGSAFSGCKSLRKVSFAEGSKLKEIDQYTFSGCTNLTEVDWTNLTECEIICEHAFASTGLTSVDMSAMTALKTIEEQAFSNVSMTSIILPEGLETIGDRAFCDPLMYGTSPVYYETQDSLNPLTELVLPSTLKKIDYRAFAGQFMDNAANEPYVLQLPAGLEELGGEAFAGCQVVSYTDMKVLSNVVLPEDKLPEGLKIFGDDVPEGANEGYGGPFAFTPMTKLVFPAGIEVLGAGACLMNSDSGGMQYLTTVEFLAKEEIIDGETVLTSNLRKICNEALCANYYFDRQNPPITIIGFEYLQKLESITNTFGSLSYIWLDAPETYVIPETVRYLGFDALAEDYYSYGSVSPFKNVVLTEGLEYVGSGAVCCSGYEGNMHTIVAMDRRTDLPVLADDWLSYDEEMKAKGLATLNCVEGSAYHKWAVEHNYPFALIDPSAFGLWVDLEDQNGNRINIKEVVQSIQWKDSDGNLLSDELEYKHEADWQVTVDRPVIAEIVFKDEYRIKYIVPEVTLCTFTADAGSAKIVLMDREQLVITGQVAIEHNNTKIPVLTVTSNMSGVIVEQTVPLQWKVEKGVFEFSFETGRAPTTITSELPGWITQTVENAELLPSFSEVDGKKVIDVGVLNMGTGLPDGIDLDTAGQAGIMGLNKLTLTNTATGAVYKTYFGVLYDGSSVLKLREDAGEYFTVGDEVLLEYQVEENWDTLRRNGWTIKPYTFIMPAKWSWVDDTEEEVSIKPETYRWTHLNIGGINTAYNRMYLFDENGEILSTKPDCGYLPLGTYTLVAFHFNSYVDAITSPDELEKMGFPETSYLKETIVIDEYGRDLRPFYKVPEFAANSHVGISVEVGEFMESDSNLVPIYIKYNVDPEKYNPELGVGLRVYMENFAESSVLPLSMVRDTYAVADVELIENYTNQGFDASEVLYLQAFAPSGTITLYAVANGEAMRVSGDTEAAGCCTFNLPAGAIIFHLQSGSHYDSSGYKGKNTFLEYYLGPKGSDTGYTANLYQNGRLIQSSRMDSTFEQYQLILDSYSEDAPTVNVFLLEVLDKDGNLYWSSGERRIVYYPKDRVAPEELSVRVSLGQTPLKSSVFALDGKVAQKQVYYFFPRDLNPDNTINKELTFDYKLKMSDPNKVKNKTVLLEVYCGEKLAQPYIKEVALAWNPETQTFDGTLRMEANTVTMKDMPYGYGFVYSEGGEQEKMPISVDQVEDQLAAYIEEVKENQGKVLQRKPLIDNSDEIELVMEQAALDDFQKELLRLAIRSANTENGLVNNMVDEIEDLAADWAEVESTEDMNSIQAVSRMMQNVGSPTKIEEISSGITETYLVSFGYTKIQAGDKVLYYYQSADGAETSLVDLANGVHFYNGENPLTSYTPMLRSTRNTKASEGKEWEDNLSTAYATVRNAVTAFDGWLGILSDLVNKYYGEKLYEYDQLVALAEKYQLDEAAAMASKAELDEKIKGIDALTDQLRHNTDDLFAILENAAESKKILVKQQAEAMQAISDLRSKLHIINTDWASAIADKGFMASFSVDNLSKIADLPGVKIFTGALSFAGIITDLMALIDQMQTASKEVNRIQALIASEKYRRDYMAYKAANGCYKDPQAVKEQYETCKRAYEEFEEQTDELLTWTTAMTVQKIGVLASDMLSPLLSLFGLVGKAIDIGLFTVGSVSELVITIGIEANKEDVADARLELQEECGSALGKPPFTEMRPNCTPGGDPGGNPGGDGDPGDGDPNERPVPPGEGPPFPVPPQPIIDPSGYVYEAVASNRVEGATAKAYYKGEDGSEVFWDEAETIGEVNPQITGADGGYAWMTPLGDWKVRVTKDGYYEGTSENDPAAVDGWLPVPPPQLNVHIPLVSKAAPAVASAAAATDRIQVVFSQYMDIAAFEAGQLVVVKQNGTVIPVTFQFTDAEESPTQPGVFYGRILKLQKADGTAFAGEGITVEISADAKNYAGTALGTAYTSSPMMVAQILGSLEHIYPNRLVTEISEVIEVVVMAKGTDGKPMAGVTVTATQEFGGTLEINATAVTDEEGRAVFTTKGIGPGYDVVTFSSGVISVDMNTRVEAIDPTKPKKPTANLTDLDTVVYGTELVLECATEGAIIYYTTDDTCPCTDSPNRKIYTGPVAITEDTLFRIASWTESGGYSERLNLRISVSDVYSVNITWGALTFTYDEGTWNADTHTYVGGTGWTADVEGGDLITVENTGTVAMNVSVSYGKGEHTAVQSVNGSFVDETDTAVTEVIVLDVAEIRKLRLLLTGKPDEAIEDVKLGSVTVTIGGN